MRYILLFMLTLTMVWSVVVPCIDNDTENATTQQEKDTKKMIEEKEGELEDAIDDYKEALEKKKEMMTTLWKTVTKVEFLMKENQILRKEIIKHWEDVKQSHFNIQTL